MSSLARLRVIAGSALIALGFVACPGPGTPTLSVSISPSFASNMDPLGSTVRVNVATAAGAPATGSVKLTTTMGEVAESTVTLADGEARTTIRCVVRLHGACVGQGEVKATWASGGETAEGTATVRFGPPTVRPDGGSTDGGDAGSETDSGVDGGNDGGSMMIDAGPAFGSVYGNVLVIGTMALPGALGFSVLESLDSGHIGWAPSEPPQSLAMLGDKLLYVDLDGGVYEWVPDELVPPGGVVRPPDGGSDAGADAGADAGGLDGSYTFPMVLGGNDRSVATECASGVTKLFQSQHEVWAFCIPQFGAEGEVSRLSSDRLNLPIHRSDVPLMVSGATVLLRMAFDAGTFADAGARDAGTAPDGGVLYDSALFTMQGGTYTAVAGSTQRIFGQHPRATGSGFQVVTFDVTRSRCFRASIGFNAQMIERPAPDLPNDGGCLAAHFLPNSDDVIIPTTLADGGFALLVYQPHVVADGGEDGGIDAGAVDAGVRVGLDGGYTFELRTDLSAHPPVLVVDPQYPIEVLVGPGAPDSLNGPM